MAAATRSYSSSRRRLAEGALATIDTPTAWKANQLRSAFDLKMLRLPVLAVFGTKDSLVVASHEAPAARAALADNLRARVVVLDGMGHWFQEGVVTGASGESAKLGPNLGSPRLVTLVGDWLRNVLAPGSGKTKARYAEGPCFAGSASAISLPVSGRSAFGRRVQRVIATPLV